MANYDGEVVINTRIDEADYDQTLNGYKMGAQSLSNHIQQMTDKVKGLTATQRQQMSSLVSKFNEQNNAYSTQQAKIEELKNKWWSLYNIEKQIASTENQIASAKNKLSQGGLDVNQYMTLQEKLQQLESEYDKLIAKKKQAFGSQTTEGLGADVDKAEAKLQSMGAKLSDTFNRVNAKVQDYNAKTTNASGSSFKFSDTLSRVGTGLGNISSKVGGVLGKGLSALKSRFDNVKNSAQGFASKLKGNFVTILKYAVGLGTLRKIAGYLRNAMKDGITAMAQADAQTKASIDSIKASVNNLKASLGSALAPLINAIAPAVTYIVNMVTKAIHYVGMLISAFTGKKTYKMATAINNVSSASDKNTKATNKNTKATKKNTKATKKNTEAKKKQNKELQRYLSGLDEMARWEDQHKDDSTSPKTSTPNSNTPSSNIGGIGGGVGTTGLQVTVKDVKIPKKIRKLAETIKKYIKQGDWEGLGTYIGQKMEQSLNKIDWKKIQSKVGRGARAVAKFLNGIFGNLKLADAIGKAFGEGLNTVSIAIDNFLSNFKFKNFGRFLGQTLTSSVKTINWKLIGKNIANGLNGLKKTIDGFWETYKPGTTAKGLATSINEFFTKTDWKGLAKTISTSIKNLLDEVIEFLNDVDWEKVGESISTFLWNIDWLGIFEKLLKLIGALIGSLIKEAFGVQMGKFEWINDYFEDHDGDLRKVLKDVFDRALNICTSLMVGLLDALFGKGTGEEFKKKVKGFFSGAWNGIKETFSGVINFFKSIFMSIYNTIVSIISPIVDFFRTTYSMAWNMVRWAFKTVGTFFSDVWKKIKKPLSNAASWFKSKFDSAWKGIKGAFKNVGSFFSEIWSKIKKPFNSVGSWFTKHVINPIVNAFSGTKKKKGLVSRLKDAIGGLGNILKSPVNAIIDGLNWLLDKFTKGINAIIKIYNKTGGKMPGAKKMPLVKTTKLPKLAQGSVIPPNKEFMAVLGDQKHGTNLEAPESLIRQIVREESGAGVYEFVAQLNRKTIFDEMIQEAKLRKKNTGQNAFLGV